jgi:hypothetical protein
MKATKATRGVSADVAPSPSAGRQGASLRIVGQSNAPIETSRQGTGPSGLDQLLVRLPELTLAEAEPLQKGSLGEGKSAFHAVSRAPTAPASRQGGHGDLDLDTRRAAALVPALVAPPQLRLQERYLVRHQWEGTVLERLADGFRARLCDLSGTTPDEYADFPLVSVSDDDVPLILPGGIFHWFVGYRIEASGQHTTWSQIRFRRLPRWSKRELVALNQPSDLDEFFSAR